MIKKNILIIILPIIILSIIDIDIFSQPGKESILFAEQISPLKNLQSPEIQRYFEFFNANSNKKTGLCLSHYGDLNPYVCYSSFTYDAALIAIGGNISLAGNILKTYVANNTCANGEKEPQTMPQSGAYTPDGGVLNNIRIKSFVGTWWEKWDWSCHAGPNAWIGMAALQYYSRTKDESALRFAEERAEFLKRLQDSNGGIRMGPIGQWHYRGETFYWNTKSTENNESTLHFFDMLHYVTGNAEYKNVADKIYDWIKAMYDKKERVFSRGALFIKSEWKKDKLTAYATDTTSWAPLERILKDDFFGRTRLERLQEVERMLDRAVELTGVYDNGKLLGVSFSVESARVKVITIEWSSQLAVRYQRVAEEYGKLGKEDKKREYEKRNKGLLDSLARYFTKKGDNLVAPYAVYKNGNIAVVNTQHGWITPDAYASVSSSYYGFASAGFDPMLLGGVTP